MYIRRTLEGFLKKASDQFPVVLVTGPRQVGKTTILRHMAQGARKYVSLDDPMLAQLAKDEPSLFLQRFTPPVLIDEIQYAPGLLPYIKMMVDNNRENGMFWLTGSQQFQLMQGVTESLAGRVGIVDLLGLSLKESHEEAQTGIAFLPTKEQLEQRLKSSSQLSLSEIYKIIWRGSFPIMALNKETDRDLFYGSYIQTYVQRDVRNLANVGNEGTFLRFLRACAARTSQMLNLSDLARDIGISVPTAKHWLSILESSNLVYLLEPYHSNTMKRLIKTPKLYFLDTGLCSYLTQWSSPETLESGAMSGSILETFIFTELLKSYWHNGKQAPFYYYRDKDKKEIDLLIIQDEKVYPLEFKRTASPNKQMASSFQLLERLNLLVQKGGIICFVDNLLPISSTCEAIPIWLL